MTPTQKVVFWRERVAAFERLARMQAELPPSERMRAVHADGLVIEDVVGASVRLAKRLLAEAEAEAGAERN